MVKKIINDIKMEYRKNKVVTTFMGIVVVLALLTYLKPGSTDNILQYIGISVANFLILAIVVLVLWWFFVKKGRKLF